MNPFETLFFNDNDRLIVLGEFALYCIYVAAVLVAISRAAGFRRYVELSIAARVNLGIVFTAGAALVPESLLASTVVLVVTLLGFLFLEKDLPLWRYWRNPILTEATPNVKKARWQTLIIIFSLSTLSNLYVLGTTEKPIFPLWVILLVVLLMLATVSVVVVIRKIRSTRGQIS